MKKLVLVLFMLLMLNVLDACGGGVTAVPGAASSGKESADMIDVTTKTLPDAVAELKAAGFTNVTSNTSSDKEWKEDRWIVVSQSVEAGQKHALEDEIKLTCKKLCLLYLDLKSESNLLFSTYDMDIYVDETLIGTVANGKTITKLMSLLEGKHTIVACKSGDNSVKATKELSVTSDITFKSDIGHGGSIEFKNMETLDSIVGASIKVPKVTGEILSEAKKDLEEAGFINVREEPYSDIWDRDNWIVTKQGVESGSEVDQNEFIQLDCIKLDQYFSETYSGKTLAEVEKMAQQSGFSLKCTSAEDQSDLSDTINGLSEKEKEYWVVTSAEQYRSELKTAKIYLKREESPEEKKAAEEAKKKAEEEKKKAEEEKKKAEEEKKKAEEEKRKAEEEKKAEEKKKAEEAEKNKEAANAGQGSAASASGEASQDAPEDSIPYNKIDSFQIEYSFAHTQFHDDTVYLANGERTIIYLTASPAGLTLDDFKIEYNGSKLSVDISEMWSDSGKNQSGCTITASAIEPGLSKIEILSRYDLEADGENVSVCELSIKNLDSREGTRVYITRNGEKYHFSADCAGPNAYATSLYEAELYEYGPCGNCVN